MVMPQSQQEGHPRTYHEHEQFTPGESFASNVGHFRQNVDRRHVQERSGAEKHCHACGLQSSNLKEKVPYHQTKGFRAGGSEYTTCIIRNLSGKPNFLENSYCY